MIVNLDKIGKAIWVEYLTQFGSADLATPWQYISDEVKEKWRQIAAAALKATGRDITDDGDGGLHLR